jgi:hypothetical protein
MRDAVLEDEGLVVRELPVREPGDGEALVAPALGPGSRIVVDVAA